MVGAAMLPYVIAGWIAPSGYSFTGFLANPADGFSYLAKMRDAAGGAWLVSLPYTHEPHAPALLYPQYIILGKLSGLTGLPPLWLYHGSRMLTGLLMLGISYAFIAAVITDLMVRRTAFVLLSTAGGLTWLTSLWGFVAADAGVQIANTFHSLYSNMHFPLATTLMVLPLLALLRGLPEPRMRPVLQSGLSNAFLAVVAPFLLFTQVLVGGVSALLLSARGLLVVRVRLALIVLIPAIPAAGIALQLYLNPAMRVWTAQNIIPSPEPLSLALGYGLLLPAALVGPIAVLRGGTPVMRAGALLVGIWLVVGPLLFYLPLPWQRRLMQGYDIPLSIFAAIGIHALLSRAGPLARGRTLIAVLGFAMLGNVWLIGASLIGAQALREPFYLSDADLSGMAWLEAHTTSADVVLASPIIGNVIPAYSDARVYWGHPFETLHATDKERRVIGFYRRGARETERCALVREAGATYVYWGPVEGRMGPAPAHSWLEPVHRSDPLIIFRVLPCEVMAANVPG